MPLERGCPGHPAPRPPARQPPPIRAGIGFPEIPGIHGIPALPHRVDASSRFPRAAGAGHRKNHPGPPAFAPRSNDGVARAARPEAAARQFPAPTAAGTPAVRPAGFVYSARLPHPLEREVFGEGPIIDGSAVLMAETAGEADPRGCRSIDPPAPGSCLLYTS